MGEDLNLIKTDIYFYPSEIADNVIRIHKHWTTIAERSTVFMTMGEFLMTIHFQTHPFFHMGIVIHVEWHGINLEIYTSQKLVQQKMMKSI